MAAPGNKGKGFKWTLLYIFTGVVDLVQIIIDFTGIGIVVSEAIEAAMPFIIFVTLQIFFKISLISKPSRLLSIIGATGFGFITGGIAPFWILDIWYLQRSVKAEDAQYTAEQYSSNRAGNQHPLYQDGIGRPRQPVSENQIRYIDGIGKPRGRS